MISYHRLMAAPVIKIILVILGLQAMAVLTAAANTSSPLDEKVDIAGRKLYIIYMGSLPEDKYSDESHHHSMLEKVLEDSGSSPSQLIVTSYTRSFNGFAAYLYEDERQKLIGMDGVISVFPSMTHQLQTTRSWDFMGFPDSVPRSPSIESDIIIGVIDSGIWPESPSFNDEGFSPIPSKWKGSCEAHLNVTCNKKLIGARAYNGLELNPTARDSEGHGTHMASIAAGRSVQGVSFYGLAHGTARGAVPSARIAVYRACSGGNCDNADLLGAFSDAIADGVDIITISISTNSMHDLVSSAISIGAFHAMEKGILTVNSAGNRGLYDVPTTSIAPWILTVAASNTDRRITDTVILGNGKTLVGHVINSFKSMEGEFPLIYGENATTSCNQFNASMCKKGCLDAALVKGKIVVCRATEGIFEAYTNGALGSIAYTTEGDCSVVLPFPVATLTNEDFNSVHAYMESSTSVAKASILTSQSTKNNVAPIVAQFSSRGPNLIVPDILKPDVTAPGVEILAAFSPLATPTTLPKSSEYKDGRSVMYSILSGTSMACPHVAGAAAYVKSFHPDWSPSAIKSALMTTAWQMNSSVHLHAEFSYGAGHIIPVRALDPGLVYDTSLDDYVTFLCNMGYEIGGLMGGTNKCQTTGTMINSSPKDLNYPSMAFQAEPHKCSFEVKFIRRVTNVGQGNSIYRASVIAGVGSELSIVVEPKILSFTAVNEIKSFEVTLKAHNMRRLNESATLVWSDGHHTVRSPIVIYKNTTVACSLSSRLYSPYYNLIYIFIFVLVRICG